MHAAVGLAKVSFISQRDCWSAWLSIRLLFDTSAAPVLSASCLIGYSQLIARCRTNVPHLCPDREDGMICSTARETRERAGLALRI